MKAAYLKSPVRCPWCRSGDIEAVSHPHAIDGSATQSVMCYSCGKRWSDIYRLNDIQEEM